MPTKQRFLNVPDGSQLEIEVSGPDDSFRSSAELRSAGKKLKSWTHTQLFGKKPTRALKAKDKAYTLIAAVSFTGSKVVTATVKTRIQKPGGGLHSKMKALTFKGKKSATKTGRVQIDMEG